MFLIRHIGEALNFMVLINHFGCSMLAYGCVSMHACHIYTWDWGEWVGNWGLPSLSNPAWGALA